MKNTAGRYCVDCQWCEAMMVCRREGKTCSQARRYGDCGMEGRLFEKRESDIQISTDVSLAGSIS